MAPQALEPDSESHAWAKPVKSRGKAKSPLKDWLFPWKTIFHDIGFPKKQLVSFGFWRFSGLFRSLGFLLTSFVDRGVRLEKPKRLTSSASWTTQGPETVRDEAPLFKKRLNRMAW